MRTPGNKTILLILGALAALLDRRLRGGGDETETTTPTVEEPAALTQDELITQGDGICAEVNAAVGALSASETSESLPPTTDEKVANLYIGMVERLQDLGAPEGDEGELRQIHGSRRRAGQGRGRTEARGRTRRRGGAGRNGPGSEPPRWKRSSPRRRSTASKTAATNRAARPSTAAPTHGRRRRIRRRRRRRGRTRIRTSNPPPKKKSSPKKKWHRKPAARAAAQKLRKQLLKPAANQAASGPAELQKLVARRDRYPLSQRPSRS